MFFGGHIAFTLSRCCSDLRSHVPKTVAYKEAPLGNKFKLYDRCPRKHIFCPRMQCCLLDVPEPSTFNILAEQH